MHSCKHLEIMLLYVLQIWAVSKAKHHTCCLCNNSCTSKKHLIRTSLWLKQSRIQFPNRLTWKQLNTCATFCNSWDSLFEGMGGPSNSDIFESTLYHLITVREIIHSPAFPIAENFQLKAPLPQVELNVRLFIQTGITHRASTSSVI